MGLSCRFRAFLAILALTAFGAAGQARAAVYNVGPTRSFKQIQEVAARLDAGDTVLVDGGSTYTGGVVFTRPGAAGRPIVILGMPSGENRPILSGGVNTVHFRSDDPFKTGADHYVFQGFEVMGGRCQGRQQRQVPFGAQRDLLQLDRRRLLP